MDKMEAAIAEKDAGSDFESATVVTYCDEIVDARIRTVVAVLARGGSKKEAAAEAGVDRMTLWRWCRLHPLEQLAAVEAEARARPALLKLSANLEKAAEVICAFTEGDISGVMTEKGVSYAREQLQLQAAKVTVGLMAKLLERSAEHRPGVVESRKPGAELSSEQLLAAARAVQARRLGKGGR